MTKKRIQVKKKLALLLASTLLVTSINVMPVEASADNQATGSKNENAVASTDLSLSIAALNANQGNTTQNATGSTNLSLEIASAPTSHDGHEGWTDLLTVPEGGGYEHEIESSGYYYLSSNVVVSEDKPFLHISGNIDVTICLNGKDISTNYYDIIIIDGNANVTITNCHNDESKICATTAVSNLINQRGGDLTLEKVTLAEKQGSYYEYPLIHVNNGGNLKVNNVKFDSQGYCIRLMDTGDINISNSNFTVDNSSPDGGGNIIYTDYNYSIGNITVTDSIFNWKKNDGISINTSDHGSVNISGSTFNCSGGISVKGGEVNVSNCTFEGTDKYSLGYAVYMTSVADKENKLTVSGGTCNTRQGGIGVKSVAAKVDLTLKGDIAFNHTSEYGDLVFFDRYDNSSKAQVNLNLGELKTQNLTMALPSIAYEDVIICEYEGAITCDADYSAILKARDTKYAVRCEEADGKYVVKFNERKITTQPTVESPKVEVSDDTDVSFQWYKAEKKEYELKDTASEGVIVPDTNEENYGTYENGVWKPAEYTELEYSAWIVGWNLKEIKGNCTVVIENSKGSLEDYKDSFNVMDLESYEPFDSNVKDGKLYFSGKADGLTISGFEIPQDAELIVKLIVPNDTEALSGQNTATLSSAQPGDYRCHIIWDEGTDYSYEILSDTLTINQAITPDEPGGKPEEPTPTPDPEEHTWTYTASGATLTATCSNDNNHKATLTLTATNPTYSGDGVATGWNVGETVAFTLAGEAEWKAALGTDAVPVIKYVGTGSTTYAESETAPTVAGTYKAMITVSNETAFIEFEIKQLHTHNGVKQDGQAATCTTDGWKAYYKCSCGAFYKDATCTTVIADLEVWKTTEGMGKIAATGHTWNKGTVTKEASCTLAGEKTYTCTECSQTKTEKISETGHAWQYTASGATLTATCSNDSNHKATLTLTATSPTYSGSDITKAQLFGAMDFASFHTATGLGLSAESVEIFKSGEATALNSIRDAGDYVAKLTIDTNKTATLNFTVKHQEQTAIDPGTVTATAPTVYGGTDGKITGVTTDYEYSIDGGVTYLSCDGTEITGLLAGTVKIRKKAKTGYHPSPAIDVTVPQGAMDNTDEMLAKAQEIVTSKIIGNEFTVSNLTTDKDIENAIKTALLKEDETKTVGSEVTVAKTEAEIGTDGQIAITVKLSLNGKDITFDLNKEIPALVGKNIVVTVQDVDKKPVSEATVKVMLGKSQKAEGTSSVDGSCAFSDLPAGLYNIVITKGEVTKTAIADLTTDDASVFVELDTASKSSSHLTVKGEETPGTGTETDKKPEVATKVEETVVKNLDVLTKALLDKEESEAVSDVASYRVDMAVEAKADTQIPQNTHNEMVKEANKGETAPADKATNIDFWDISIIKTITKSSGTKESEQIADTGDTVIEIIIPFNFTGKKNIRVLREHNGVVKKFEEIVTNATGTDGTYKMDVAKGLIILYATNFSTYAVSYVAEGEKAIEEPATPTPPAYTGGGSTSAAVPATGITVEADKVELTKAGETLAIKAVIQPSNATDKKLTFTSSDEKVAKVDANGVITAVGNGTVTITIKAANGITKTIAVTVNIPSDDNKDDGNKDDGNKEDSASPEEEVVTPEKIAANAIAISKGLKVSQRGTKINVSWGKVAGADGYLVYAAYCGIGFGKAVKTIKDPSGVSTSITKINGKKLDIKKNFKVYVKAYKVVDGKKTAFGKSITAHIAGAKNTKNTNVKELKLTSKSKLTLAVGKTSKIKAKAVLVDSAKKQLSDSHTKEFRYASSDKKVAAVDKNGKITAKAKGTCYIYVYARNGYAKKVTVTVK